jgi:hypothetical protein
MADSFTQPHSPGFMATSAKSTSANSTSASSTLPKLRSLVQTYISLHQYSSALYWADNLVTLSLSNPKDTHMLAHCLLLTKQYHRASHLVVSKKLHTTHMGCCYMAAKALHMAGEEEEALLVPEDGEVVLKDEELQKETEYHTTVLDSPGQQRKSC